MSKLKSIRIKGFRSIREMTLELSPLNILIGANGAGKSDLIAFFRLVNEMMGGRLQQHIGATGRATGNLYFGPRVTPQLEAEMVFQVPKGTNTYQMRLYCAAGDSLMFADETLSFHRTDHPHPQVVPLGAGHQETRIGDKAGEGDPEAKVPWLLLDDCRVHHFHDTSPTSRVRQSCCIGDDRRLMADAANLAAVLYRLKSRKEPAYRRIVETIRQVAPFFEDFELEPTESREIILNWRHRASGLLFGPHQLSDGTLRAICLISLLMQPREDLPLLVVVDEPELGLHPYALNVIASLFQAASHHTQVLVSTQSSAFLDRFEPEDIVVVERSDQATGFSRPDPEELAPWLENYSLGEIWEKNIIGGGPH